MRVHVVRGGVGLALGLGLAGPWAEEPRAPWSAGRARAQAATESAVAGSLPSSDAPSREFPFTAEELGHIRVYETANRSVVNIETKTREVDQFFLTPRESEGAGSGAVIDQQGHLLTNYHVVEGAQQIVATLAGNQSYPAELVGYDQESDIAVLRIAAPPEELFPVAMGESAPLRVGQRVYALGNPFGWEGTLTTGIVSSLNRNLPSRVPGRQMESLIQTDAAMNPGNSGGPLLDTQARMIGMCVAIATRTGQNTGVGFAIPIDRIKSIVPELIAHGRVVRADIGITHVVETNQGLVIARLAEGGPAERAGLRGFRRVVERRQQGGLLFERESIDRSAADRILAVDGAPVRSGVAFRDKIWEYRPGDAVVLTVVREGVQQQVRVVLGSN
jgi:S1-C subfamily serine protease